MNIRLNEDLLDMYFHIRHQSPLFKRGAAIRFYPFAASETDLLKKIKTRQVKAFNPDSVVEDLSDLIKRQIQPWLKNCRDHRQDHEDCRVTNATVTVPTRLVDVGNLYDHSVKVVQINSDAALVDYPYLILSYCWGKGNETARTTASNFEDRLHGLTVKNLPKTIQDSITLTRMMGFRYLWIDAMCIIQASKDSPGDFETEAVRMRDYYANAECCISASLASDSSEGFLVERPLARFPIEQIGVRVSRDSTSEPEYLMFESDDNDWRLDEILLKSPLMQRGWYLQEMMLSHRILHWTFHGLYLQCRSSLFLEGKKEAFESSRVDICPSPRSILTMPDDTILSFHGWCQLLALFSWKELTFETDRMYAIHGLACLLIERLGVEYFNGLFRPHLGQGLLWYNHHGTEGQSKGPRNAQLPSWCWASNCPLTYKEVHSEPVYILDTHPRRPLRFPTHPGNMTVVESPDPRLFIKAPLIKVTLGKNHFCHVKNRHSGQQIEFECWYYLDNCRETKHSMDRTPNPNAEQGQGIDVIWMPIGRDKRVWHNVAGLLVEEMRNEEHGTYQRYGFLDIEGLEVEDFYDELEDVILK